MPDFSCILSAVLFWVANILNIVYITKERRREHYDFDDWTALDPNYIENDWDFRLDHKQIASVAGWLNAAAWLVFLFPMMQLTWILSDQGTRGLWRHVSIAILILGGTMTEWLARLFWIGSQIASQKIVSKFNIESWVRPDVASSMGYPVNADGSSQDELGWLVLEVNHIQASGFVWFVDSFEWLCLSGAFMLIYVSVRDWRVEDKSSFGGCWNNLGLFLSFLAILEFTSEVLRFQGFRTFGMVAILYAIINRLVLIPIWIVFLAFALPRAVTKQTYDDGQGVSHKSAGELALTDVSAGNRSADASGAAPQFTIGDTDAE